jgi:hypothetical protein
MDIVAIACSAEIEQRLVCSIKFVARKNKKDARRGWGIAIARSLKVVIAALGWVIMPSVTIGGEAKTYESVFAMA